MSATHPIPSDGLPDTSSFNRNMITLTVMLGALMAVIDTSIVNVSMPEIGVSLGATVDELSLIATGYIIAEALIMPLIGWLTSTLGRKRFYMMVLGLFTLSSFACGLAWDIHSMAVFRILQGLGGGALIPTAQAIMLESTPREKHGQAMAVFGLGVMAGPAIGPTLGGWITENYAWQWIFNINVPLGILTLLLAWMFIQNPPYQEKRTGRMDWLGLVAMIIGLSALQFVLEEGNSEGWFSSDLILLMSVIAGLFLLVFIVNELLIKNPVVNLRVLKNRSFLMASLISIVMGFGLYGLLLILPLFMESMLGYNAFQIGVALLPGALATAVSMPIAGLLADKFDPRASIGAGLAIMAFGMFKFAGLSPEAGYWDLFWPQGLRGFGMGLIFVPLTGVAMSEIPKTQIAGASGLYTLLRQIGGSFGIAILATLLINYQTVHMADLSAHVSVYNPQAVARLNQYKAGMIAQGSSPDQAEKQALSLLQGTTRQQAALLSYIDLFRFSGVAFLLCYIPLFFIRRPKKGIKVDIGH